MNHKIQAIKYNLGSAGLARLTFEFNNGEVSPPYGTYIENPPKRMAVPNKHVHKLILGKTVYEDKDYALGSIELREMDDNRLLHVGHPDLKIVYTHEILLAANDHIVSAKVNIHGYIAI